MLAKLFGTTRADSYVSVDIGSSSIKLMELDVSGDKPKLVNAALAPSPASALKNNMIVRPDEVGAVVRNLIDNNGIASNSAIVALPGPSVFTKKVSLSYSSLKELRLNIELEAGNYVPHNLAAVHLDYQVVDGGEGNPMDVLLVAVKNEIILSFTDVLDRAGLEPAVADVDYFALENMFELNYPEEIGKTVALVNIGARYTSISILENGQSLFNGDVGVGGRLYTDALCETLELKSLEAEQAKMGNPPEGTDVNVIRETMDRTTDHVSSELHRQLGFFWNAAATEKPIEMIYLTGGGSQVSGLVEELSAKTGMPCQIVDPFRNIDCGGGFDAAYLSEIGPSMSVAVGLSLRFEGDKVHAID